MMMEITRGVMKEGMMNLELRKKSERESEKSRRGKFRNKAEEQMTSRTPNAAPGGKRPGARGVGWGASGLA
jgi:hypothetical protein